MKERTSSIIMISLLITAVCFNLLPGIIEANAYIYSEPAIEEWRRTYGGTSDDVAWCVIETDDGGYAMLGFTYSFGGGQADVYLIKTDAAGTTEWERTYGDSDWERGYCLIQTEDGGYAIAGEKAPSPPPSSSADDNQVFLRLQSYGQRASEPELCLLRLSKEHTMRLVIR